MQVETDEPDVIERVAALDVGEAEVRTARGCLARATRSRSR
jgi:hypothetical protein